MNIQNEYVSRTVPGVVGVLGLANPGATVTVNGLSTTRRGEYFWREMTVNNSSVAVWAEATVGAVSGGSSSTIDVYEHVAKTPEVYTHDADGNLLTDGRWNYTWDGENRLVKLVKNSSVLPANELSLIFDYDPQGRRIRKRVWSNTGSTGTPSLEVRYLYDGWNLLAELNSSQALQRGYVWGQDLSGTLQGAGGVGGLLMIRTSSTVAQYVGADGNGNVVLLVDRLSGATTARYEYGPFGESLRATGTQAAGNSIRFSSKYTDSQTGFLYYGYRYYNPTTGRWLNRDPIGEEDGPNIYAFLQNDGIKKIDFLGLESGRIHLDGGRGWFPTQVMGRSPLDDCRRAGGSFTDVRSASGTVFRAELF